MKMKLPLQKVIIIGCGPAGIAAAIQLKRLGIKPLAVFERRFPGGLLRNANLVENYPGFPNGISGKNLSSLFVSQLSRHSIPVYGEEICSVAIHSKGYLLKCENGGSCLGEFLIAATGTVPVETELEIPAAIRGKVFYEIADTPETCGKSICIAGGGDCAFDYALNLAARGAKVDLRIRSDVDRTFGLLRKRAGTVAGIGIRYSSRISSVGEKDGRISVVSENPHGIETAVYDYLVFAIGRKPSRPLYEFDFEKQLRNDTIYEIGDVKNGIFRQVSLAVANGVEAAMRINFKLRGMQSENS